MTACFQAFAGFYLSQGFKAPSLDIKRLSVPGPSGPVFRVESWRWSSFCCSKNSPSKSPSIPAAWHFGTSDTIHSARHQAQRSGQRQVSWETHRPLDLDFWDASKIHSGVQWVWGWWGIDISAHNKGDHSIRKALCLGQFRVIESRVRSRSLIHIAHLHHTCALAKCTHTHTHWWLVSPAFPACFGSPDRIEGSVHFHLSKSHLKRGCWHKQWIMKRCSTNWFYLKKRRTETESEMVEPRTESKDLWSMVTLQFLCSKGVVAVAESCDLHGLEGVLDLQNVTRSSKHTERSDMSMIYLWVMIDVHVHNKM